MDILILGLNHKSAPLHIREKVAFPEQEIGGPLRAVNDLEGIRENLIVSTCNRVEILLVAEKRDEAVESVRDFIARYHTVDRQELDPHLYLHEGGDAIRHIYRVASSLDSLVVGEPQILGQVKDAYDYAREAGTVGLVLDRLLNKTLTVAKKIRTETGISRSAVSISFAAVELAKKIFGETEGKTAMIIGAGEMGELALRHLVNSGIKEILVANRTFEKAVDLAKEFGGTAVKFEDLHDYLVISDIVISSTGAPHVIIHADDVKKLMGRRKYQPMFFIDIAVPRDIDGAVNDIDNAYLYNVDDLQAVVESNIKERSKEAEKAEAMVQKEVATFQKWVNSLQVVPTIVGLRRKIEKIRESETEKFLSRLPELSDRDRRQVRALTNAIVNKILHRPQAVLKDASHTEEAGLFLEVTRKMFDLPDEPEEGEKKEDHEHSQQK
jgi:glutamyl-tRNA reductase